MTRASEPDIQKVLKLLDADMARKSPRTRRAYKSVARDFMEQVNDFSRKGMVAYMNQVAGSKSSNTARLAYSALAYMCKALEIRFTLDKRDLPALPEEDELRAPAMPKDDVAALIGYWKRQPDEYLTSLAFISTVYAPRLGELTDVEVKESSIVVNIEKRKARATREHLLPDGTQQFIKGYKHRPYGTVKVAFRQMCRDAGVPRQTDMGFHGIRRTLNTQLLLLGLNEVIVTRYMRWKPTRAMMTSVYFHMPYNELDNLVFNVHPFLKLWREK